MSKEMSWENWWSEITSLWGELGYCAYGLSMVISGGVTLTKTGVAGDGR